LLEAGRRRFRPVLLTSLTTVAGLAPMLVETSFQAQVLVPMAATLAFGLMASTVLVLITVPTIYSVYGRLVGVKLGTEEVEEFDDRLAAAAAVT
jgi:multidrug efflux pump subunit AcrB